MKFISLDIKYRFTCGELIRGNTLDCKDIMSSS